MTILQYGGKEPTFVPAANTEKILELMLKQLEVLKLMATSHILIPESSRIRTVDRAEGAGAE